MVTTIKVRLPRRGDREKFLPRYSGSLSKPFWKTVNHLPKDSHGELYSLGCVLQNVEYFVLARLESVRKEAKKGKKKYS
jgi:hypothetical protein